jgi:PadR family transcriptional regulator PadR
MNTERHTQWLRGVLDLCVLAALKDGERYGYELAQQLLESGLGQIKGGTLYPLLARLEKAGHVSTEWRQGNQGPGRKYYFLTSSGKIHLQQQSENWLEFSLNIGKLLPPERRGK